MMRTRIASLVAIIGLSSAACSEGPDGGSSNDSDRNTHELSKDGRYIITYESEEVASSQMQLMAERDTLARDLPSIEGVAAYLSDDEVAEIANTPGVESVEPDRRRELSQVSPAEQSTPYGIDMVQAPGVWERTRGEDRTVCIIDSGFDRGHESLQTDRITGSPEGWDTDGCGHGTHVGGTIAALDNDTGVLGVLPDGISMHIVKVFGDSCSWSYSSELIDAVAECQEAGADVVNMSLGGGGSSDAEKQAFDEFYEDGMLVVAAAGNSGQEEHSYPASYDSVLSVAAVDNAMERGSFSTYNDQVEISAPGVSVRSTMPEGGCVICPDESGYGAIDGTSMASPHVAGVAALIWSFNPEWSNEELREALAETARDLGEEGRDSYYGHGLVQAKDALKHLISDCTEFGCEEGWECDEESGQCIEIPETLAFYDFDGESRQPVESAERSGPGDFDNRDGDAGFVEGDSGEALSDNGWEEGEGNYFETTFVPAGDAQLVLTDLGFDERPSATGPTHFEVDIVDGSTGELLFAAEGSTEPGAWSSHFISLGEAGAGPFQDSVRVRISAGGAEDARGTWRLDNIHVEGHVHERQIAPVIESTPPTTVQAGEEYTYKVSASGMPEPAISVSNLPFWLSFDGNDTISGVAPNFAVGETDAITVRASNGVDPADSQELAIDVAPAPSVPLAGEPIVEDFGTGMPTDWYAVGGWEAGVPESGPEEAVEGHAVAGTVLDGNYAMPTHDIMASPVLDFSGIDDAAFSFHSWHQIDGCFHGINVLLSTDGGESFEELEPASVSPSYDGEIQNWDGSQPMEGQQGWCGESGGWRSVDVDLESNLGSDRDRVMIVLQLGSDGSAARSGWYVDALRIGSWDELPVEGSPLETLALYDFEGEVKSPIQTASGVSAGAFDNPEGDSDFVLGDPGLAITENAWRDSDGNYFEMEIAPEQGREVAFAGLTFDERPSSTGPTDFKVLIVSDGAEVPLSGGTGTTTPGAWSSHGVPGDEHFVFSEPVKIRIAAEGGTHPNGTWRLDNVRFTGYVD